MINFLFSDWVYDVVIMVYIMTVLGVVVIILSENRNPLKSIAWIFVLIFLPIAGLIFYLFFGRDFRKMRLISRKSFKRLNSFKPEEIAPGVSQYKEAKPNNLAKLNKKLCQSRVYQGNKVEVLTTGESFFRSMLEAIKGAKSFIHIQFYIIDRDDIGNELINLLIDKVKEGVVVRIIYDDVGSWGLKRKDIKFLRDNGISVFPFLEVKFRALADKINYRNHRKIVIIDGALGYIGGMNVADRYINGIEWGIWRDTQLKVEGPAVHALQTSFSVDWYFCTKRLLKDAMYYPKILAQGDVAMQIVTSGPVGEWRKIMLAIFSVINSAKRYVYIQTPYFLPPQSFLLAIQTAALSNVDVRLMLPARSDSKIVHIGSCSFIEDILKAGVKVYHYTPGFLHSKMVVVDDKVCTIGSANMDFRSFEHNFESNAFIYNRDVAVHTRRIFLEDQRKCRRLSLRNWRNRPISQKALESIVRLFSPLL